MSIDTPSTPLPANAARHALARLQTALGVEDQKRLQRLFPLIREDGYLNLGEVLVALYPAHSHDNALSAWRQFRKRLRDRAAESGFALALATDNYKHQPPERRFAWFTGEDPIMERADRYNRGEVGDVDRHRMVRQEVIDLTQEKEKIPVRYFVSYAHKDHKH
ncbi:MAG: hypothetical protein KJO08_02655, partial [Gammaproteobacteria bacterium]|nr:hypothetical protein [Gammaproteobacteria bacterium]